MSLLDSFDKWDRVYSSVLHQWELQAFDIFVFLPAIIFGVWGVPFFVIWYWLTYNSALLLIAVLVTVGTNEGLKYVF